MEPEGSLPSSQELSTCTYPEPDQSSPQHSLLSLKGPSWNLNLRYPNIMIFLTIACFLEIAHRPEFETTRNNFVSETGSVSLFR
jgi:hypothetical protein